MAGIGFELRRLISAERGAVSKIRAYASAGLISSGPWIMTALTLCLVSLVGSFESSATSSRVFQAIVTYAFAFSLVTVGAVQMAVTRWIADMLYRKEHERILSAFLAMFAGVALLQTVVGGGFSCVAGLGVTTGFLATALYVTVSLIWLALVWLTVIREYNQILLAYSVGAVTSVVLMLFWGHITRGNGDSLNGYLGSYAAGQALTLTLLVRLLVRGLEDGERDFSAWACVRAYPALVVTGLAYSLGIWVDKMVFWFGSGLEAAPWIHCHPLYDTTCFLAYVTVIPALSINLIHLETSFYEHYRRYYLAILGHMPLATLEDRRVRMMDDLRAGVVKLIRLQGAISVAAIVLAPWILDALGIPAMAVRVFRFACLGAFFHVLLLITILIQLYFDLRKQALVSALVFLVANTVGALVSVRFGFAVYGVGYAAATLFAVVVAFVLLDRALRWLDYLTFVTQLEVKRRS